MRLGEVIRKWRVMSELSIRDAAAMIGISATTMPTVWRAAMTWMEEP
jgi:hypothetical protein